MRTTWMAATWRFTRMRMSRLLLTSNKDDEELTAAEISQCRGALGAVQWLAVQTQSLLCAWCNLLLSDLVNGPTIRTAKEIQGLITEARRNPCRLIFKKLPGVTHWQEMRVVRLGDQAHCNRPHGGSTGGLICTTGFCHCPKILAAWPYSAGK